MGEWAIILKKLIKRKINEKQKSELEQALVSLNDKIIKFVG